MLFLTVDMDVKQAGLDSGNIWLLAQQDLDAIYKATQKLDLLEDDEFAGLFISCTSLKDPISFDGRYHTIEAITYINYEAFETFKLENNDRSTAYLQFKEQIIKKILRSLERVIPGITASIVHQELGTPITNEYYINTTDGNVYGTEKSLKHIGPFTYKMKSEIENLYLCGASTLSHGVAGASYSGVQTAAVILGCKQDDLIQADNTQQLRIFDAEDDTDYPDWMQKKIAHKKARLASNHIYAKTDK